MCLCVVHVSIHSPISAIVCEQSLTRSCKVCQPVAVAWAGSSPDPPMAPPAWSVGCYLIVTKWRNTNTQDSTMRLVQPRRIGHHEEEAADILESREHHNNKMSLSVEKDICL